MAKLLYNQLLRGGGGGDIDLKMTQHSGQPVTPFHLCRSLARGQSTNGMVLISWFLRGGGEGVVTHNCGQLVELK